MAPEQIGGDAIDHRADLYAVGSVLFELISGEPPHDADELGVLLARVLHARAPMLSSRARLPLSVRDDLDSLIARCLEKEPCDRPSSAIEVIAAIDDILARLPMASESERAPQLDIAVSATLDERRPLGGAARGMAIGALIVAALCVGARHAMQEHALQLQLPALQRSDSRAAASFVVPERGSSPPPAAVTLPPTPPPVPPSALALESTRSDIAPTEPILVAVTSLGKETEDEDTSESAAKRRERRETRTSRRRAFADAAVPVLVVTKAPEPPPNLASEPALPSGGELPPLPSMPHLPEPVHSEPPPAAPLAGALDPDGVLRPFR
jgi:serine/threonine protein kinase